MTHLNFEDNQFKLLLYRVVTVKIRLFQRVIPGRTLVLFSEKVGFRPRSFFRRTHVIIAEKVGFEPTVRFPVHTLSRRAS
jgi:hypothetical protein